MKEDSSKAKKGFSLVDNAITDIKIPGKRANKAGFVQLPNLLLYC